MNVSMLRRIGFSILVVTWLFVVLVSYYLIHKPFALESFSALPNALANIFGASLPQFFFAFGNVLDDIATVIIVLVLASVVGHRLSTRWNFVSALEASVMWTGIGLGALALIVFTLAALGFVNQWGYWILIVATLVLLRNDLRAVLDTVRGLSLPRPTRGDNALAWFCALALGVTFLLAFTPPWGWDGLQYHLVLPKLILEQGRLTPPPDTVMLNFPGLIEMLFLLGMILRGDGATQAFHWIYLPLTLSAMFGFASRYFSARVGWLACALFCAVPTALLLSTWAYNDLALTFYTFTAFLFALRARETGQTRDFVLIGVLCGLAFGEKLTAFFVPLALVVLLFRPQRAALQNIFVMLIVAGALAAPWWLRNLVFVGNPVYPFVFGGKDWDAFRAAWYSRFGSGMLQRPLELLMVPWTMTIQGTQSDLFQANIGPLLLALLPLNLIPSRALDSTRIAPLKAMWFFAGVLYFAWLLGVAQSNLLWQSRLLLPAFPLFCLLAARGLEKLSALALPQFSIQRFAAMVVALVLALTALSYALALLNDRALGYFFGAVSRDEYLTGQLGAHYETAQWVNANLPRDARILFLWETRAYYFARKAEADAILDRFVHLNFVYGNAPEIANNLRAQNFTHVLLYREGLDNILQTGYDPLTNEDMETLRAFVANELEPLYGAAKFGLETRDGKFGLVNARQEPYTIYQLKP